MNEQSHITGFIKEKAIELGFEAVGFAKARRLDMAAGRLQTWLDKGNNGRMAYMENHFEKRVDPTQLVSGAKTVVSLLYNYYPVEKQREDTFQIAKYAYGKDYHFLLKKKLKQLYTELRKAFPHVEGRYFTDSAPVLEGEWAQMAGLGWIGKNSLLINPGLGSFFFLAELIINVEVEYDAPVGNHCGTCTKCIEACPTEAIAQEGFEVDASKCISYLTIELKEAEIPEVFKDKMKDNIFGCDICQDVCPWNKFAKPHREPYFTPSRGLLTKTKKGWLQLTEKEFDDLFVKSPVRRTKYKGLMRNIRFNT